MLLHCLSKYCFLEKFGSCLRIHFYEYCFAQATYIVACFIRAGTPCSYGRAGCAPAGMLGDGSHGAWGGSTIQEGGGIPTSARIETLMWSGRLSLSGARISGQRRKPMVPRTTFFGAHWCCCVHIQLHKIVAALHCNCLLWARNVPSSFLAMS
jgi:hypothetical protein